MTYSVTNTERENHGSVDAVFATLDVTSLDSAGTEPVDTDAAFGLADAGEYGVAVRGLEDDSYRVTWDHINEALSVTNAADGTDVTSGTDIGEVVVSVVGV